ncbi:HAD family hydrolase [Actinomyces slackii]|uniref:Phosphatase YidA n=1 Tax=Actinomyces slackii TaxID=52774 RepID=A0A3S4SN22_9ACTO|nr:Phosphatase YidA [Actinomyces slackii]
MPTADGGLATSLPEGAEPGAENAENPARPARQTAVPAVDDPIQPSGQPLVPQLGLGGSSEHPGALLRRRPGHEEYHGLVQDRIADLDALEAAGGAPLAPDSRTLVALDVDGTILDMDGCVSERVMASIARLRAYGVPVVISTGRGVQAAMPVARHVGLTSGWMICANGALTVRLEPDAPGGYEVVDQRTFDPGPAIAALLEAIPDGIAAVEVPGGGFKVSRPFPDGELIEGQEVVSMEELCSRPVTRVVLRAPGMGVEEFSALVAESGLHSVTYAIGWTAWLDVAPQGVTKASALEALTARLGLEPARALAVGDGSNDVEMIEWAGVGAVMGSAPQWVRDRGNLLTAPVWSDGCAAVLDALVERARQIS